MQINDGGIIYDPTLNKVRANRVSSQEKVEDKSLTEEKWSNVANQWHNFYLKDNKQFTEVNPKKSEKAQEKSAENLPSPEDIIKNRNGSVLKEGTILKADQYTGIHNKKLQGGKDPQPIIEGAPNYRQIGGSNIHGVAQPTIDGMKKVLEKAGAGPGPDGKKALWTSMREEPVVYVNGRPLNLRAVDNPYKNMENSSLTEKDIEKMENQLKKDLLKEAEKNGGKVLLHDEGPDGKVVSKWETVTPESFKTTKEVFKELKKEGYKVDYARIPVSDEKTPEDRDFDALTKRLKDVDKDTPLIFNCHAGRGRTTTAMVAAELIQKAKSGEDNKKSITSNKTVHEDIREQGDYKRGEYKVILGMIKLLKKGPQTKDEVDAIIDKNSGLQNLREAIQDRKVKSETETDETKRNEAKENGEQYLKRYFSLIAFDSYAKEQAPAFKKTFSEWMKERPDLYKSLDTIELAMGFRNTDSAVA